MCSRSRLLFLLYLYEWMLSWEIILFSKLLQNKEIITNIIDIIPISTLYFTTNMMNLSLKYTQNRYMQMWVLYLHYSLHTITRKRKIAEWDYEEHFTNLSILMPQYFRKNLLVTPRCHTFNGVGYVDIITEYKLNLCMTYDGTLTNFHFSKVPLIRTFSYFG